MRLKFDSSQDIGRFGQSYFRICYQIDAGGRDRQV